MDCRLLPPTVLNKTHSTISNLHLLLLSRQTQCPLLCFIMLNYWYTVLIMYINFDVLVFITAFVSSLSLYLFLFILTTLSPFSSLPIWLSAWCLEAWSCSRFLSVKWEFLLLCLPGGSGSGFLPRGKDFVKGANKWNSTELNWTFWGKVNTTCGRGSSVVEGWGANR